MYSNENWTEKAFLGFWASRRRSVRVGAPRRRGTQRGAGWRADPGAHHCSKIKSTHFLRGPLSIYQHLPYGGTFSRFVKRTSYKSCSNFGKRFDFVTFHCRRSLANSSQRPGEHAYQNNRSDALMVVYQIGLCLKSFLTSTLQFKLRFTTLGEFKFLNAENFNLKRLDPKFQRISKKSNAF